MQHSHEILENNPLKRTSSSIHAIPIESDGSGHGRSRRNFLALIVGTGFAGMSLLEKSIVRAALARSQAAGAPTNLFEIEKVAEGIYAALARPTAMINSNAAIFV